MKARPELFISTKNGNTPLNITPLDVARPAVSKIFAEIDKYSITPTTFKSRTLNKEDLTYIDKYSHKDNEVIRFGINASNINIDQSLLGAQIKCNISASKRSVFEKGGITKVSLHSLEKQLLQEAVTHLLNLADTKTVLVDIFARVEGQIRIDNGIPETHTVVLYKNLAVNGKHEVLVIDPSNFRFSSHVANPDNVQHITDDTFGGIKVSYEQNKIYTPTTKNIGPNPDQYRDCIDIAVKLAFGLNKEHNVDISKVINLGLIQEITNQAEINKNLPLNNDSVVRIRQASDDNTRKLTNKLLVKIDNQLKSINQYQESEDLEQLVLEKNLKVFKQSYESDKYKQGIEDLFELTHMTANLFKEHIDKIETKLQGEFESYMEEQQ